MRPNMCASAQWGHLVVSTLYFTFTHEPTEKNTPTPKSRLANIQNGGSSKQTPTYTHFLVSQHRDPFFPLLGSST